MLTAKKKFGIIFFPAFDWAISSTHPEREERLLYTQDQLREEGIFDIGNIGEYKPEVATHKDVMRTHFSFPDIKSNITDSHLISAGGSIKSLKLVMDGEVDKTFAMVRPPGHHAMKVVHGNRGFCNINNEAIMVEYLRDNYGFKKVAIVDTDCHHGDGTQDIYWNDPAILFISLHQDGRTLYPGSGFTEETGGPNAPGKTINIPLPPGTGNEGVLYVLDEVILPILKDFKPDLVINSAGQDNHYTDPITNMNFSAQGYAMLNEKLDPDICVLEGGYSIQGALPYVNLGIILAMAGLDYSYVKEPDYFPDRMRQDQQIMDYIKKLSDFALNNYYHPPGDQISGRVEGDFVQRKKNIFYDTDYISDQQIETVRICNSCAGLLKIESNSTHNSGCIGIEIPFNACGDCQKEGHRMIEETRSSKKYRFFQVIDRQIKKYEYIK